MEHATPVSRKPGPAPSGVLVETLDGVTRIALGIAAPVRRLLALAWIVTPLILGALAYRAEPRAGYAAATVSAIIALLLYVSERRARDRRQSADVPAVCLDANRIWIERPVEPQWVQTARAVFAEAPAPDAPAESLPLDSMPRRAVERVRVEPPARLLIEAEAGRLELSAPSRDRKRLEWVRDYLRFRLTRDD